MTYAEIAEFLENTGVYKTRLKTYLENRHPDVYSEILGATAFLDASNPSKDREVTFGERLYCIRNGVRQRPVCPECKKGLLKFKVDEGRYAGYCSQDCARHSGETRRKREETSLERHGTRNYRNCEKGKATRLARYGAYESQETAKKRKTTLKERYGDEKYVNWAEIRKTNLERYGCETPFESPEIIRKCVATFQERHPGMKSTMDMPGFKEKLKAASREKSWRSVSDNENVRPLCSRDEYMKIDDITKDDAIEFECKKCGTVFRSWWYAGHARSCPGCAPLAGSSGIEEQIARFLGTVDPDRFDVYHKKHMNRNVIPPKEIDIVMCDKSGGIVLLVEVDGLFFHSSERMEKAESYHLDKTERCEALGYRLVHVFENEWLTKRKIVESRLRTLLGTKNETVFARKCEIGVPSRDECDMFLEKNHLQGSAPYRKAVGLYRDGELLSVMTFGRCRFSGKYEWELIRLCTKAGLVVVGGASRMLKRFESAEHPRSLVSYADRRWSKGDVYRKMGFSFDHFSSPNYWYFKLNDTSRIFSRMRFQKHKQPEILKKFDENKTEVENMLDNGYDRIFDCGNMVFVKRYPENEKTGV